MSTKVIVWIIVVILVVLGLWYWWDQSQSQTPSTAQTSAVIQASSTSAAGTLQSGSSAISSGSSNADLNTDLNTIDTQTSGANSDSASVDQSFNDQPVQQTQP